jgi:hypothetical protein
MASWEKNPWIWSSRNCILPLHHEDCPIAAGFRTATEKHPQMPLTVEGVLFVWLRGILIRTGPAQFDINGKT